MSIPSSPPPPPPSNLIPPLLWTVIILLLFLITSYLLNCYVLEVSTELVDGGRDERTNQLLFFRKGPVNFVIAREDKTHVKKRHPQTPRRETICKCLTSDLRYPHVRSEAESTFRLL
ncbi:hypothetical protein VTL71DRAFT_10719 [Oculimacula yallundae]|uniref:ATP synthase F0 subunit 8 n=1 Tax=Oculimacula yallundae TaxID=86028 RepID=A0ABR4CU39_9HELO